MQPQRPQPVIRGRARRFAAIAAATVLSVPFAAALASPASAHHEQSCRRVPVWEEYQVRVGTDYVHSYDSEGNITGVQAVPRMETRRRPSWGTECTTIEHAPEPAEPPRHIQTMQDMMSNGNHGGAVIVGLQNGLNPITAIIDLANTDGVPDDSEDNEDDD